MSKYLQLQVILLILLFLLNAIESGWVGPLSISYNRVDYLAGVWLTDTTNILVGNRLENGAIIKTTDGGTTWSTKLTPTSRLFDVASVTISNVQYVITVANDGKIYHSSDGGDTWASVTVTTTAALYGVSIGSNGNAFTVGYQTTPSAQSIIYTSTVADLTTWTSLTVSQTQTLNGVVSRDGINAIAVGAAGTILKSTNSGVSWQSISSGTTADLYSISQISATVAMAAGSAATVLATADGGSTWRSESLAGYGSGANKILSTSIFYFRSIAMLDAEGKAFLVSPTNIVLLTRNAGVSWAVGSDDLQYPLYSIAAYNESVAVIGSARAEATSQSAAFKRTAGSDFSPFPTSQPTSYPTGVTLKNTTWFRSYLGSSGYIIRSAAWSSANNVVMVGSFTTTTGIIVYSKNAGFTWTVINTPNVMTSVATRTISNTVYFIAVSASGSIYLSTTLGKNWTNSTATMVSPALYGVTIGRNGNAYTVGYSSSSGSIIHKSTVPFTTWSTNIYSQSGLEFNNVRTYDGRRVIVIGNNGLIVTSDDSGVTWHTRHSGTTGNLYSISGISSTRAVVAGTSATVLKTTDAGSNWTATGSVIGISSVTGTTDFLFNSISMVSEPVIYLAGSNGALLVSVNGGVNWRDENNIAFNRQAILYSLAMYSTGTGVSTDSDGNAYVKYQTVTSQPSRSPTCVPTSAPLISYYPTAQPSAKPSVVPTATPTYQFEVYMLIPVSQDFINISIYAGPSFALTYSTDTETNIISLNPNRSDFQKAVSSFITSVSSDLVSANITSTTGYFGFESPTFQPTLAPVTLAPTLTQSPTITYRPTKVPTQKPASHTPSITPSKRPTSRPSYKPSVEPTFVPTRKPTIEFRRRNRYLFGNTIDTTETETTDTDTTDTDTTDTDTGVTASTSTLESDSGGYNSDIESSSNNGDSHDYNDSNHPRNAHIDNTILTASTNTGSTASSSRSLNSFIDNDDIDIDNDNDHDNKSPKLKYSVSLLNASSSSSSSSIDVADAAKYSSNINQGLTFNYTLFVLVEFSHLGNQTFGKHKNLSYFDVVYEEIYKELKAMVVSSTSTSSSSSSLSSFSLASTSTTNNNLCSTVMQETFINSSSFHSMKCESRIHIGPYTLGESLQNTKSPHSNDDMIGSLTRRDFIILMCFMSFLFISLIVLFKIAFQGSGSDDNDNDGEESNFTFLKCLGICFSVSCCSCIFCWKACTYLFHRKNDDDDDDDDDDNNKKTTKVVGNKGGKVAESKQKDDDEDDDEDDDDDEENKDGWFSRMFRRKKSTGDDDDDDIGNSKGNKKSVKKDDDDEDDDDDDDDDKKKKGGWFSNIFGGKKKTKNDDDDGDDDDDDE